MTKPMRASYSNSRSYPIAWLPVGLLVIHIYRTDDRSQQQDAIKTLFDTMQHVAVKSDMKILPSSSIDIVMIFAIALREVFQAESNHRGLPKMQTIIKQMQHIYKTTQDENNGQRVSVVDLTTMRCSNFKDEGIKYYVSADDLAFALGYLCNQPKATLLLLIQYSLRFQNQSHISQRSSQESSTDFPELETQSCNQSLDSSTSEHSELHRRLGELEAKNCSLEKLRNESEHMMVDMRAQHREMDAYIETLQSRIHVLEQPANDVKHIEARFLTDAEELQCKILNLEKQNEELKHRNMELTQHNRELTSLNSKLVLRITELDQHTRKQEEYRQEVATSIKNLESQLETPHGNGQKRDSCECLENLSQKCSIIGRTMECTSVSRQEHQNRSSRSMPAHCPRPLGQHAATIMKHDEHVSTTQLTELQRRNSHLTDLLQTRANELQQARTKFVARQKNAASGLQTRTRHSAKIQVKSNCTLRVLTPQYATYLGSRAYFALH